MTDQQHKSQRSETRNTPCEVRMAYIFAHQKKTKRANGAVLKSPRHEVTILVPKTNADAGQCSNYKFLAEMCMEAAGKAWGQWPQGGKWPIQDGDVPYAQKPKPGQAPLTPEQIAERNKWRTGHWVIEATNNLESGPKVAIMQNGQIVEIPARVVNGHPLYKSGDYGFVSLQAYTYQNETFGVNFGFEGILFTRPGEAIGSSGPRSAEQMFGGIAPPAGSGVPAPGPVGTAPAPAPVQPAPTAAAPPPLPPQTAASAAPPPPPAAAVPVGAGAPPLPPFPTRQ